ncbi:transmembrane protein 17-like [Numida meleagris]|uniref:transmembrane protein 17-like n=1 Tax=Numida meleagris TaxID=8996 RepID=UPI000B3DCB2B|nr:transmembrane protein 17-like [Numida meleagris]
MGQRHRSPLPPRYPRGGSLLRPHCRQRWVPAPPAMGGSEHQCCCSGLRGRGGMLGVPGVLPSPALPCPAHEVLASLPLQMMLYFNAHYFPCWCLAEGMMLQLKVPSAFQAGNVTRGGQSGQGWGPAWNWEGRGCAPLQYNLLPRYYQLLLLAAFLILTLAEAARLYLGYIGNLQEKVPELAGFLLLSILIQLPLLLFLLTDHLTLPLPLELAVHSLLLAFLVCEVVAAFLALRAMSRQLAAQFYLRQFKVGSRGDAAGPDPPRRAQQH